MRQTITIHSPIDDELIDVELNYSPAEIATAYAYGDYGPLVAFIEPAEVEVISVKGWDACMVEQWCRVLEEWCMDEMKKAA